MVTFTNTFTAEDWVRLRGIVGWNPITIEQAQRGIESSSYKCAAVDNGRVVAISRFLFDGSYIGFISDVIVEPAYQRQGIGRHMIEEMLMWFRQTLPEGTFAQVSLNAAVGKEPFYKKLGFEERPNDKCGAGMMMRF